MPTEEAYFKLFETTGWNEDYQKTSDEIYEALNNSFYFTQCYIGDELVGSGRVISDGVLYGMIYDIIVDPQCHDLGIGSEITHRLIEHCLEHGIKNIQLFSAIGKMPFYKKFGFEARKKGAEGMVLNIEKWREQSKA
jgi:ribosomal protein S18 acetylase RimI-like enzyme